jgi:Ca2+-transporting ATPase
MPDSWHDKSVNELAARLVTDPTHGLPQHEAVERLAKVGPNELRKGEAVSPPAILASQFSSLVVWVLIAAALVSVALGELVDGTAIIAIVVLNALILRHCEICCDPGTSAYG